MKYFFRSVRYVLPYRGRLIGSAVCVFAIAILWAGGFATMVPGMKILISDEGLHGWADQVMVEARLQLKVTKHQVVNSQVSATYVARVVSTSKKSVARQAGLKDDEWIIGGAAASASQPSGANYEQMLQALAQQTSPEPWNLLVYNPTTHATRTVTLTPKQLSLTDTPTSLLYATAARIARPDSYEGRLPMFVGLLVLGIVLTILRAIAQFLQEFLTTSAVLQGMVALRCEVYESVLRLPVGYFSSQGTTDMMSRFVQDSGEITRGQETLLGKTMVEPGKLAGMFAIALYLNWQLTLMACVAGPPAFFLIRRLSKLMKRASKKALQGWSGLLSVLEETLTGIRVVKGYTMEPTERQRFLRVSQELYRQQRRMVLIEAATSPSIEVLGVIAAMGAAAFAGQMVLHGSMDRGDFLGLMIALAGLFDPVRKLAQVSTRFHRADAAAARVFELRDQEPEPELANAPLLPRHGKSIEFRNVTFTYPNAARPALECVNLTIRQGESVAIVGPNGSGKTTLLSLLPRFFDPQKGSVLIDGKDIGQHSLRSLRGQIGVVTQETIIFHATVGDNIAYGLESPSPDGVVAASKKAFADEFICQMPEAYNTMISERGATLSGGQRQRIAIARAIIRDPAILIFDEAMSQIDSESEAKIQQALETVMVGRTTLTIAHRFSTVINADRVVVMVDGRIVDVGKHAELLERCPTYRRLFETQLMGAPA